VHRDNAEAIYRIALRAVDATAAVARHLRAHPLPDEPLVIVGAGKAAAAMAAGALDVVGDRVVSGVVVVKDGHGLPLSGVEILEASHPVPDLRSLAAGGRLVEEARRYGPEVRRLGLWSGGASALAEVLAPGVSLSQLDAEIAALNQRGAPIDAINAHRRMRSALKGGQLVGEGERWTNLVISDVPTDRPALVGSGPAIAPGTEDHVVATLSDAVRAARAEAERRGYVVRVLGEGVGGSAVGVGESLVQMAEIAPRDVPRCFLVAGEPTVRLSAFAGRGGRMQQAALAAALRLRRRDAVLWFAGTDGTDGPTDAAGAWVDADTAERIRDVGLDPERHLRDQDAYAAFDAVDALIRTGPTRTNVRDLWFALVGPTPPAT